MQHLGEVGRVHAAGLGADRDQRLALVVLAGQQRADLEGLDRLLQRAELCLRPRPGWPRRPPPGRARPGRRGRRAGSAVWSPDRPRTAARTGGRSPAGRSPGCPTGREPPPAVSSSAISVRLRSGSTTASIELNALSRSVKCDSEVGSGHNDPLYLGPSPPSSLAQSALVCVRSRPHCAIPRCGHTDPRPSSGAAASH